MTAGFILIVAVVLVLGSAWVWMNILMFRHKKSPQKVVQTADLVGDMTGDSGANEAASTLLDSGSLHGVQDDNEDVLETAESSDKTLHVLADAPRKALFARIAYPFRLNETVAAFESEAWRSCFYRLTDDEQVLGWIAFNGEAVGASDREYEVSFLEVLRSYQRTIEKLRKEVGLSHIAETSVVAEEGKIWFFSLLDDTWLVVFADPSVDMHELSSRLINPILD